MRKGFRRVLSALLVLMLLGSAVSAGGISAGAEEEATITITKYPTDQTILIDFGEPSFAGMEFTFTCGDFTRNVKLDDLYFDNNCVYYESGGKNLIENGDPTPYASWRFWHSSWHDWVLGKNVLTVEWSYREPYSLDKKYVGYITIEYEGVSILDVNQTTPITLSPDTFVTVTGSSSDTYHNSPMFKFTAPEAGIYQVYCKDAVSLGNESSDGRYWLTMVDENGLYMDTIYNANAKEPSMSAYSAMEKNQTVFFILDSVFVPSNVRFQLKVLQPQITQLNVNVPVQVDITKGQPCRVFSFTPPDNGCYAFYSGNGTNASDPYADMSQLYDPYQYRDAGSNDNRGVSITSYEHAYEMEDFFVVCSLRKDFLINIQKKYDSGDTYYITAYDKAESASYSVKVVPSHVEFKTDAIKMEVGQTVPLTEIIAQSTYSGLIVGDSVSDKMNVFTITKDGFKGVREGTQTIAFYTRDKLYRQEVTFTVGNMPQLKWWQRLPDWAQWLLRYICFGWLWMRWF